MSNRITHLLIAAAVVVAFILSTGIRRAASTAADEGKGLDGRPLTPAGKLIMDATTRQPAVGALPVGFARCPDHAGPAGSGRYLVAINSGFGIDFNTPNHPRQSLSVIDLNARPEPAVVENVYFASPQSANVGIAFDATADADGAYRLYVSGGFENKIWRFHLHPGARPPLQPAAAGPSGKIEAEAIDVNGFATRAPSPGYNNGLAPVYPTGLAISPDGREIFIANNLADSLGIISEPDNERKLARVDLRAGNDNENVYPYAVAVLPNSNGAAEKVYVSCWSASRVAVVDPRDPRKPVARIPVEGHPTAMILNAAASRLYVVNSGADSVSVIDTGSDKVVERINTKLAEQGPVGNSPEALTLSPDDATLYVANAHSNSVAVIDLSATARGARLDPENNGHQSKVKGFIPTGYYPSALALVGRTLFIGNGKGTGFKSSSVVVDNTGMSPNLPNDRFPATSGQGGQYILSLISGNISAVDLPDDAGLARYTQQALRNNGLIGRPETKLFKNGSPIKHVIYIIKENRTYDQVFGDISKAGNGQAADGDPDLAILGDGDAAARPGGAPQQITPNHHALALRFGLLDRFFVNAEASPDGHNWSTAAFSSDYVDKAYRWNYSGRGRTYDFEGFNRLPDYEPPSELPPVFHLPVTNDKLADYLKQFVPYLNGSQDAAEPETLYLWDAAARAGLTYRNYGEFIGMVSAADVASINSRRRKYYPDLSPTVATVPTKKSLEGHFCPTTRSFDLYSPDIMTTKSYQAARPNVVDVDPAITADAQDPVSRGTSRFGAWLAEFRGYVAALKSSGQDTMPNFCMLRFPNDHTAGMRPGQPTPQFYVADNDYAVGRLVEEVSSSPYWKDTAIFLVEDDAQAGPDHVDAHRSPALVISAYNRPGALIHSYHTTVSLIRTMELLLGISPMNQLDANATPIDVFQDTPDLQPYKAVLPIVTEDNLLVTASRERVNAYWIKKSQEQDLEHPDMADPAVLNGAIWFSARGSRQPSTSMAALPAADALRLGLTDRDQGDGSSIARR